MSGKKHILEGEGTRCNHGYREALEWEPGDTLEDLCCNCAKSYFLRKGPKQINSMLVSRHPARPAPASAPTLTRKQIKERADRVAARGRS